MRQRGDPVFVGALNHMARGQMTPAEVALFQGRVAQNQAEIPREALHLFRTNAEVNMHNNQALAAIQATEYISHANDVYLGPASYQRQRLEQARNLEISKTYGLPLKIAFKVGARYMVTSNIDTQDGLVNGAIGILGAITLRNVILTVDGRRVRQSH